MQHFPLNFDYQSSTPCSQEVVEAMTPYWHEFWGNPSSRQNHLGIYSSAAVSVAREKLASFLKIKPERLIFTSGATESNNLALLGCARAMALEKGGPGHLITMTTEHHAVLDPMRQLQKEGFRLTELKPDSEGILSLDLLRNSLYDDTFLVSIMVANNEIGVIQPISQIASICKERGIAFHSDASQGFGYLSLDFDKLGFDLLSISGHKIYGPKGIGALIMRDNLAILPLQWGGGQEDNYRPGTLPVPLIVGLAKAAEIAYKELDKRNHNLEIMRNKLLFGLEKSIPNLIINGSMQERLPHNLNISISGVNGHRLHREIKSFISCSSGSACANGSPSHVLLSIGRSMREAEASLRLSIGRNTTLVDIEKAISIITDAVNKLLI